MNAPVDAPWPLDRTVVDPVIDQAAERLAAGDGGPALDALAAARTDPERRTAQLDVFAAVARGHSGALAALSQPDGPVLHGATLLAEALVIAGPEMVPGGVDEQRARAGTVRLRRAERALTRAADQLADDPVPWYLLQLTGARLGADPGVLAERWRAALARGPVTYAGALARLVALSPGTAAPRTRCCRTPARPPPTSPPVTRWRRWWGWPTPRSAVPGC